MGRHSDYKKLTSGECHYCDIGVCRKGHRCNWYKRHVKKNKQKKGRIKNAKN